MKSRELESKVKTEQVLNSEKFLARYFGSWLPSTIHMATSSESFQTVESLAKRLSVSKEHVEEVLQFLSEVQLVKKEGSRYRYGTGSIYLPRSADLNEAHQTARRVQALRSIAKGDADDMHFASIFTLNKKDLEQIKKIFSEAVKTSHEKIQSSGTEELYGICLDVFAVV
jgi:hypothetical protein